MTWDEMRWHDEILFWCDMMSNMTALSCVTLYSTCMETQNKFLFTKINSAPQWLKTTTGHSSHLFKWHRVIYPNVLLSVMTIAILQQIWLGWMTSLWYIRWFCNPNISEEFDRKVCLILHFIIFPQKTLNHSKHATYTNKTDPVWKHCKWLNLAKQFIFNFFTAKIEYYLRQHFLTADCWLLIAMFHSPLTGGTY